MIKFGTLVHHGSRDYIKARTTGGTGIALSLFLVISLVKKGDPTVCYNHPNYGIQRHDFFVETYKHDNTAHVNGLLTLFPPWLLKNCLCSHALAAKFEQRGGLYGGSLLYR